MKVIDLEAPLLSYWVAKSLRLEPVADGRGEGTVSVVNPASGVLEPFQPGIDWSQAGPIMAEEWYQLEGMMIEWLGTSWSYSGIFLEKPLVWMMRAFVALQFGQEVEDV